MSIFENMPPWAQQGGQQQQSFNPAPQIMSPYQHGQQAPMQMPPMPQAPQDPSGATTASPMGAMGGVASMLGNPGSAQGPGGLMSLLAAIQKANAPSASGTGLPSMIDNQMPGAAPGGGTGGIFSFLSGLFK